MQHIATTYIRLVCNAVEITTSRRTQQVYELDSPLGWPHPPLYPLPHSEADPAQTLAWGGAPSNPRGRRLKAPAKGPPSGVARGALSGIPRSKKAVRRGGPQAPW